MSIKPILFYTDMVRALLANRKTVTRRVVKMPAAVTSKTVDRVCVKDGAAHFSWSWSEAFSGFDVKMPYRPGDILYVRETWQNGFGGTYLYRADAGHDLFMTPEGKLVSDIPWRPSIHMPREAARIFLRVTDVQVERLQDITEECAFAEGAQTTATFQSARYVFRDIWDNTIKSVDRALYGWAATPWVWVIEFERCESQKGD